MRGTRAPPQQRPLLCAFPRAAPALFSAPAPPARSSEKTQPAGPRLVGETAETPASETAETRQPRGCVGGLGRGGEDKAAGPGQECSTAPEL